MTRRVLVTNIPVHSYVEAYVEVPDDTTPETLHNAIVCSLKEHGVCFLGEPAEVDTNVLDKWEFNTPLGYIPPPSVQEEAS